MNLRPLVLGPAQREAAARILAYAEAHPYYPGDSVVPGDIPQHVLRWEAGYKAVFSFTVLRGVRYRHLSVSVEGRHLPNPHAVQAISQLFGFQTFQAALNRAEHCITVAERAQEAS